MLPTNSVECGNSVAHESTEALMTMPTARRKQQNGERLC
ncbi:hypothetical protein D083_1405 [Dickeya solani RNS 08.23.3.1.A]|nr:hypothetical protein D083_1405 [Dickeya solani RNS 08.23.3.1.A]